MSSEADKLIKTVSTFLQHHVQGEDVPDKVHNNLVKQLDAYMSKFGSSGGGGGTSYQSHSSVAIKDTASAKKALTLEDFTARCEEGNEGKIPCSHVWSRGKSEGKYCGTKVKDYNSNVDVYSQLCTGHLKNKSSKKDNSSSLGVGSRKSGVAPYGPGASNVALSGVNTLAAPLNKKLLNIKNLKAPKKVVKEVEEISEDDFYVRKTVDGKELFFTELKGASKLFFSKNGSKYVCEGKVDRAIENSEKPLPKNFPTLIKTNFKDSETEWLESHNIKISKGEEDSESENEEESEDEKEDKKKVSKTKGKSSKEESEDEDEKEDKKKVSKNKSKSSKEESESEDEDEDKKKVVKNKGKNSKEESKEDSGSESEEESDSESEEEVVDSEDEKDKKKSSKKK